MKKILLICTSFLLLSLFVKAQQTLTESFGSVASDIAIATHETADGFDLDQLTYSGTADVSNSSANVGANIFFNANGEYLLIEGITPNGSCVSLGIQFLARRTAAESSASLEVEYSSDGVNFTSAGFTDITAASTYELEAFSGFPGTTTAIKITKVTSGSPSTRIDDLEIIGSGAGCLLPISLTSFTAQPYGNNVMVKWATESEENNDFMAVQRSTDGRRFAEIGRVKGNGTTLEPQQYSFVDENPQPGINYYRLRQVDFDGTEAFHKVVAVSFKTDRSLQTLYPTTATDQITFQSSNPADNDSRLSIIDINGRTVKEVIFPAGETERDINISDLASGMYFVRTVQGTQTQSLRFVKQ